MIAHVGGGGRSNPLKEGGGSGAPTVKGQSKDW